MSTGKGDANRRYAVHGDGLASIRDGFNELAMPEHRRAEAFSIVSEVLAANRVVDFRWYRTEVTNELACYWDDQPTNVLWVTPSEVHIPAERGRVTRPPRPVNWEKEDGAYVGWRLPGAERGTGGGRRKPELATVLCPQTFIRQPAGSVCPDCDCVHGA